MFQYNKTLRIDRFQYIHIETYQDVVFQYIETHQCVVFQCIETYQYIESFLFLQRTVNVLNVLDMPKEASLACWALFLQRSLPLAR